MGTDGWYLGRKLRGPMSPSCRLQEEEDNCSLQPCAYHRHSATHLFQPRPHDSSSFPVKTDARRRFPPPAYQERSLPGTHRVQVLQVLGIRYPLILFMTCLSRVSTSILFKLASKGHPIDSLQHGHQSCVEHIRDHGVAEEHSKE